MTILTELQDGVFTVTLNRPQARNAINGAMRSALIEAWSNFRDNDQARVGILTGAGDKSFCARWRRPQRNGRLLPLHDGYREKRAGSKFAGSRCHHPQF